MSSTLRNKELQSNGEGKEMGRTNRRAATDLCGPADEVQMRRTEVPQLTGITSYQRCEWSHLGSPSPINPAAIRLQLPERVQANPVEPPCKPQNCGGKNCCSKNRSTFLKPVHPKQRRGKIFDLNRVIPCIRRTLLFKKLLLFWICSQYFWWKHL